MPIHEHLLRLSPLFRSEKWSSIEIVQQVIFDLTCDVIGNPDVNEMKLSFPQWWIQRGVLRSRLAPWSPVKGPFGLQGPALTRKRTILAPE